MSGGAGRTTQADIRTARLDSLTGLRFAAALAVFCHHITVFLGETWFRHLESTLRVGPAGVSFFFVLSGFVLMWSRRPDDRPAAFLQRRFARIWPAHAVAWVAGVVVVLWTEDAFFAKSSVLNLALLQVWVPQRTWYFSVNVVSWSLAVEWFFYLVFGLLLVPVLRLGPRAAARALGVLIVAFTALEIALQVGLRDHEVLQEYFVYIFPPTRLLEFAMGMCLAVALPALPDLPLGPVLAATAAVMLAAATVPEPLRWTGVTILPFVAVIAAAAQADLRGARTVWSSPTLVRLGTWSFAFYLVHQLVVRVVDEVLPWTDHTVVGALLVLAVLVVSLAAAALLHTLVEAPAERWLRRRGPAARAQVS